MKFAASIEYISDMDKVCAIRPLHRAYLTTLLEAGQLVAAGPYLDVLGALIIYEAATPEAVEEFIRNDPFHANGIFVKWTVRPWNCVFGNPQLLPPHG
jgi:uncharacterized protein